MKEEKDKDEKKKDKTNEKEAVGFKLRSKSAEDIDDFIFENERYKYSEK